MKTPLILLNCLLAGGVCFAFVSNLRSFSTEEQVVPVKRTPKMTKSILPGLEQKTVPLTPEQQIQSILTANILNPDRSPNTGARGQNRRVRLSLVGTFKIGKSEGAIIRVQGAVNQNRFMQMGGGMFGMPGMDNGGFGSQMKDMMSKLMPSKSKKKRLKTRAAYDILVQQARDSMLDEDRIVEIARARVEQSGIVFIDEIDKVASSASQQRSSDISREGVQRDLLPVVEGCAVNTKHGMIHTDHILFIAAGAFHFSKPSDLIPELQGRFPIKVELKSLTKEDFVNILTMPQNAITLQ